MKTIFSAGKSQSALRRPISCAVALLTVAVFAPRANAAFNLWNVNELYTNSSGTLQFIELQTSFSGNQFVGGEQIQVVSASVTHKFTVPSSQSTDSANKFLLFGTAGLHSAGRPTPDFLVP